MRVKHSQARYAYERIVEDAQFDRHRILILPAKGVDAICSVRILVSMLSADSIPYQVQPVSGYDDILSRIDSFVSVDHPSTIILINCGATIDLTSFLNLSAPERQNIIVYVFDSHRPFNLTNIEPKHKKVRVVFNSSDDDIELPADVTAEDLLFLDALDNNELDEAAIQRDIEMHPLSDDDFDEADDGGDSDQDVENYLDAEAEVSDREDDGDDVNDDVDDDSDGDEDPITENNFSDIPTGSNPESVDTLDTLPIEETHSLEGDLESSTKETSKQNSNLNRRARQGSGSGSSASSSSSSDTNVKRPRVSSHEKISVKTAKNHRRSLAELRQYERAIERVKSQSDERRSAILDQVEILEDYYRISYISQSVAFLLFTITDELRRATNDDLWCSMVSIAYNFSLEQIDNETYEGIWSHLAASINLFSENLTTTPENHQMKDTRRLVRGVITESDEFAFPLVRFWCLLDAVRYSRLASASLRVWTERGESELKRLFVKMAISLRDAKKPFELLSESFKKTLRNNLNIVGPTFGLLTTSYHSFVRKHTTTIDISAVDLSLALEALSTMSTDEYEQGKSTISRTDNSTSASASTSPSEISQQDIKEKMRTIDTDNFWKAFDSLEFTKTHLLQEGIRRAKQLQVAIVNQGVAMLKKKEIDTSTVLHMALIDSAPDHKLFSNPNALTRLGYFLLDLISLRKASRPLILGILIEATNSYLVIGLSGLNRAHSKVGHNAFGRFFREASSQVEAHASQDGFDSFVINVAKDHMTKFYKQLVIMLARSGNTLLRTM